MSVNNIVRYPAKQGNFSATQTLVDVEIPSGSGVWNLSKCYIDIPVKPTYTETSAAPVNNTSDSDAVVSHLLGVLMLCGRLWLSMRRTSGQRLTIQQQLTNLRLIIFGLWARWLNLLVRVKIHRLNGLTESRFIFQIFSTLGV